MIEEDKILNSFKVISACVSSIENHFKKKDKIQYDWEYDINQEIETIQFTEENKLMIDHQLNEFKHNVDATVIKGKPCLIIPTLEGEMRAEIGDWIIRGVKGELYPCKPDIFELTYEDEAEG